MGKIIHPALMRRGEKKPYPNVRGLIELCVCVCAWVDRAVYVRVCVRAVRVCGDFDTEGTRSYLEIEMLGVFASQHK